MLEPDLLQHLEHARTRDAARCRDHVERERDVLLDGAAREQLEVLEHDADSAAQFGHRSRREAREAVTHELLGEHPDELLDRFADPRLDSHGDGGDHGDAHPLSHDWTVGRARPAPLGLRCFQRALDQAPDHQRR